MPLLPCCCHSAVRLLIKMLFASGERGEPETLIIPQNTDASVCLVLSDAIATHNLPTTSKRFVMDRNYKPTCILVLCASGSQRSDFCIEAALRQFIRGEVTGSSHQHGIPAKWSLPPQT